MIAFAIWQVGAQKSNEYKLQEEFQELLIPRLDELIDAAIAHNSMLNYRRLEIDSKGANIKAKRRDWTRNFGIRGDTRYGTFDNFSSNVTGSNTTTFSSNSQQFNYGIGLYLKIPVFDLVNRKSEIKLANTEYEQAKSLAKVQEDELREVVIRSYQDLILKQKLLELNASNFSSAAVNMEMVEKEFRNGLISISEYVRITDMTSRIAAEYENTKSEFTTSKKLLENITGIVIY